MRRAATTAGTRRRGKGHGRLRRRGHDGAAMTRGHEQGGHNGGDTTAGPLHGAKGKGGHQGRPYLTFVPGRGYVPRASGDDDPGRRPKREPCEIQGLPRSGVTLEDRVIGHWVRPGRHTVGSSREGQR